jgi:6-pyruvoyltetrahydropterin/6-carboxytetrahydropterin synthase
MTDSSRPVAILQRWEMFCASHRLYEENLSREENDALYGPCAREFGHGHNYRIGVTIKGAVDPRTGMVINIVEIKEAIQELIIEDMDHRHLNHDSKLMRGINPTAENLAVACWNVLFERFGKLLHEIQIEETPNNQVIYRGERT